MTEAHSGPLDPTKTATDVNQPPGTVANGPRPASHLPVALEAIGAGAGLVVYAYAAGGVVEYLRLAGAHLPAAQAVSMLSNQQLLIVGAFILLMALPIALAMRLAAWLWTKVETSAEHARESHRTSSGRRRRQAPKSSSFLASEIAMLGVFLGALAGLIFSLSAIVVPPKSGWDFEAAAGAIITSATVGGIFALLGRFATVIRQRRIFKLRDLSRLPRRWIAALVLFLALVGGSSLAYFAPLRLPSALLRLRNGNCLTGLYLSRDNENLNLVNGRSRAVLAIASKNVNAVQVGTPISTDGISISQVPCPRAFEGTTKRRAQRFPRPAE